MSILTEAVTASINSTYTPADFLGALFTNLKVRSPTKKVIPAPLTYGTDWDLDLLTNSDEEEQVKEVDKPLATQDAPFTINASLEPIDDVGVDAPKDFNLSCEQIPQSSPIPLPDKHEERGGDDALRIELQSSKFTKLWSIDHKSTEKTRKVEKHVDTADKKDEPYYLDLSLLSPDGPTKNTHRVEKAVYTTPLKTIMNNPCSGFKKRAFKSSSWSMPTSDSLLQTSSCPVPSLLTVSASCPVPSRERAKEFIKGLLDIPR